MVLKDENGTTRKIFPLVLRMGQDDDGNTISNEDQIGDVTNKNDHDFSCIGDTINITDILSDCNCVSFSNSSDSTSSFACDFDEESSISHSSSCQSRRHCCHHRQRKHCKCYWAPPLPSRLPRTNKHKQQRHGIHIHLDSDDDDVSAPGISIPNDDDSVGVEDVQV